MNNQNNQINWQSQLTQDDQEIYKNRKNQGGKIVTKYKFNEKINRKIFLTLGNVLEEKTECLVLQTCKSINTHNQDQFIKEKIQSLLNDKTINEMRKIEEKMSLSDCVSMELNIFQFKYLFLTVLPKFSVEFKIACESSLHQATRNIIDTAITNQSTSILIGDSLFVPSKTFPVQTAIAIVLRTLKRCLEKVSEYVDRIHFCVSNQTLLSKIEEGLKIYFPRSNEEEVFMDKFVPDILESEYGDLVIPERNLKIESRFISSKTDIKSEISKTNLISNELNIHDYKIYREDDERIFSIITSKSDFYYKFMKNHERNVTPSMLEELSNLNFIKNKGNDSFGGKLFIIQLSKLNFNKICEKNQEEILLYYLIKFFQKETLLIEKNKQLKFCLIISLYDISRCNYPSVDFMVNLMNILNIFDENFWVNVEIEMVNSGFLFRTYLTFLRIYIPNEIYNRIFFLDDVEKLVIYNLNRKDLIIEDIVLQKSENVLVEVDEQKENLTHRIEFENENL